MPGATRFCSWASGFCLSLAGQASEVSLKIFVCNFKLQITILAPKIFLGLVKMTLELVNPSYSWPKLQPKKRSYYCLNTWKL